jgi:hypothetical protein
MQTSDRHTRHAEPGAAPVKEAAANDAQERVKAALAFARSGQDILFKERDEKVVRQVKRGRSLLLRKPVGNFCQSVYTEDHGAVAILTRRPLIDPRGSQPLLGGACVICRGPAGRR